MVEKERGAGREIGKESMQWRFDGKRKIRNKERKEGSQSDTSLLTTGRRPKCDRITQVGEREDEEEKRPPILLIITLNVCKRPFNNPFLTLENNPRHPTAQ